MMHDGNMLVMNAIAHGFPDPHTTISYQLRPVRRSVEYSAMAPSSANTKQRPERLLQAIRNIER